MPVPGVGSMESGSGARPANKKVDAEMTTAVETPVERSGLKT